MIRFTEQQPETFSLTPAEPQEAPVPFVFREETPEDMNNVLQNREERKQAMRQSLVVGEDDARQPFGEDIERIGTEIDNAQTDTDIERLEGEVAALQEQIRTMELARGPQGRDGEKGERGPKGERGEKGEVGPRGPKGPKGDTGLKWVLGKNGKDGKDGKDGTDMTPEEVKDKLASLEVKDRWFDWGHLKNIPGEIFKRDSDGLISWGGTTLRVNGTAADSQTILDLTQGTGITITDNGSGVITFATTITQYTDEMAQDALGNSVGNGLDYDDATGAISVDETELLHNSLGSKQGGAAGEFYHLTSAQNTLVAALDSDLATFSLPASTTISAFGASLVDDANAAAALTTLGLDADLATFSLPASTTISSFGASLIDDANASDARTTLGLGTIATLNSIDISSNTNLAATSPIVLTGDTLSLTQSAIDHGSIGGLSDDDHTQYALLAGRSGGQTLIGGTASGNNLILQSTSNATKGSIVINDGTNTWHNLSIVAGTATVFNENAADTDFRIEGTSEPNLFYVDASANRIGIGTSTPSTTSGLKLHGYAPATGDAFFGMGTDITNGPALNFGYAGASFARSVAFFNIRPDASATGINPSIRFLTSNTECMILTKDQNVKIGGTAVRATTEGTNHLDIFNGTAPVGTLTNGISLYSTSGELRVMDAAGNPTLLSPHDKDNNWIFDSYVGQGRDRKRIVVDMQKMMYFLNEHFGLDFIHEFEVA